MLRRLISIQFIQYRLKPHADFPLIPYTLTHSIVAHAPNCSALEVKCSPIDFGSNGPQSGIGLANSGIDFLQVIQILRTPAGLLVGDQVITSNDCHRNTIDLIDDPATITLVKADA